MFGVISIVRETTWQALDHIFMLRSVDFHSRQLHREVVRIYSRCNQIPRFSVRVEIAQLVRLGGCRPSGGNER